MIDFNFEIIPSILESPVVHKYVDIMKRDESMTTKAEFVIILLLVMNRINETDMLRACTIFDRLDKDGSKLLSINAIRDEINNNNNNNNNSSSSNSTSIRIDDNESIQNPITF